MKSHPTKKILFVLQLPPPIHGSSIMNRHVVDSLVLKGHFNTRTINLQFSENTSEIEKFSMKKVGKAFHFARQIVSEIRSQQPDLVYFTPSSGGFAFYRDVLYVFLMKLCGCKIVLHLHGKGIHKIAHRNFLGRMLCKIMFNNNAVICLSEKLKADIQDVYQGTPFVVANGIQDQPNLSKREVREANPSDIPRVLYLSNYFKEKGVLVLIEALKLVKAQGLQFKARLVGAPGNISIAEMSEYVADLGLQEEVEVVGPRYGEDKTTEFQMADIFTFPTFYRNEAFPLVNLEAMQFGLPIISTDEGGISDMIHNNEEGFIVQAKNPQALADKLSVLIQDYDLRICMGNKGLAHFNKHYTIERFEQNLDHTFQEVLNLTFESKAS